MSLTAETTGTARIDRESPKWQPWPNIILVDTPWYGEVYREAYQSEALNNSTMRIYVISWDAPGYKDFKEECKGIAPPEWLESSTSTCMTMKSTLDLASVQEECNIPESNLFSEIHDLLWGMAVGRPIPRSAELRDLAREVVQSRKAAEDIDIDAWAKRLAEDVANLAD